MHSEHQAVHHSEQATPVERSPLRRALIRSALVVASLAALLTVTYYSVSAYRLSHGVKVETPLPVADIRVGLINGTADLSLTAAATQQLQSIRSTDWSVTVASHEQFSLHRVKESFLICRDGQRATAEAFATRIGIPSGRIVDQPVPVNSERITVSLVLGEDFPQLQHGLGKS